MYIITILTVATNDIEVIDCFNCELTAQNRYLDKVSELSKSEDKKIMYESVFVSKTKANIHKREPGWIGYYKEIYKIVTLHKIIEYDIKDA